MSESTIEKYLRNRVEDAGGICKKWVCPGWAGVPDRIVFLPGGRIFFVELKDVGEKPRKLQAYRAKQLGDLGQDVRTIDSRAAVDEFMREVVS